jgi:hypothetical protein
MSELSNHRHERFARAVAAGIPVKYAYEIAGCVSYRGGDAYRLADHPEVMIRVAELRAAKPPTSLAGLGQIANELRQLATSIEHLAGNHLLYGTGSPA